VEYYLFLELTVAENCYVQFAQLNAFLPCDAVLALYNAVALCLSGISSSNLRIIVV